MKPATQLISPLDSNCPRIKVLPPGHDPDWERWRIPAYGPTRRGTALAIRRETARAFGIPESEINGRSRVEEICWVRHVTAYLTSRLTRLNLKAVGRIMRQDRGTVRHSIRVVGNYMDSYPAIAEAIQALENKIKKKLYSRSHRR